MEGGKAGRLVRGFRGRAPADVDALTDLLHRLARLAQDLPEVAELDLNPVLASAEGCAAVDARRPRGAAAATGAREELVSAEPETQEQALGDDELALLDAWWRAANYLSVGQIYLLENPLLREPLQPEQIKPRLLGHFGTTPGLNLIYVHLNRAIRRRALSALYVTGPGHGGPGLVANAYLEGTYSEVYPHVGRDEAGLRELFRQFSFPGGIPSHVAPETPGSIHEGGELGYALAHAYGAAFDNPDLRRRLRRRRRRGRDRAARDELALRTSS